MVTHVCSSLQTLWALHGDSQQEESERDPAALPSTELTPFKRTVSSSTVENEHTVEATVDLTVTFIFHWTNCVEPHRGGSFLSFSGWFYGTALNHPWSVALSVA